MIPPIAAAAALACATSLGVAAEPVADARALPRVPPTAPDRALSTFRVKPGFRVELVAAEPLVVDPIAMSFDEDGRLFVVEMRDYSERRPERLGRIRRLEDADGDGRFDQSEVFVANLPWPTALTCYDGGVFVGTTPDILYCKDTDGDGKAEVREVVFTGFASDYAPFETNRLNVQALLNSFNWSLDNRIHGASGGSGGQVKLVDSPFVRAWLRRAGVEYRDGVFDLRGRDLSFDPRTLDFRPESGGAQYGLSFDSQGRKFVCSNSDHIQQVMFEDRYLSRNPGLPWPAPRVSIAADGPAAPVYRISPDEPWRVLRTQWRVSGLVAGPIEGGGRASGYFTGATGVTVYRGDALGEEFAGDAFVADCGSNLVHRKKLRRGSDGVTMIAERPADEEEREFLASTDTWFRPVQFANGPEGALYVADMYREVIEHPWSLPEGIKKHLDLNSGNDRGRIYRIVPETFKSIRTPRLGRKSASELARLLDHANGWHRETAARLLYERRDPKAVRPARAIFRNSKRPEARLAALHALHNLGALKRDDFRRAFTDHDPFVRSQAARLAEHEPDVADLDRAAVIGATDPDPYVRLQWAFTLGRVSPASRTGALTALLEFTERGGTKTTSKPPWTRESPLIHLAAANAAGDAAPSMFRGFARRLEMLSDHRERRLEVAVLLARLIGSRNRSDEVSSILDWVVARIAPAGHPESRTSTSGLVALPIAFGLTEGLRLAGNDLQRAAPPEQLDRIFSACRACAEDPGLDEATRIAAVRLLGHASIDSEAGQHLLALVESAPSLPLQEAAVAALARLRDHKSTERLIDAWPRLSPALRSTVLQTLLLRAEGVVALLSGLERGIVSNADLSPSHRSLLLSHREPALRERAQKLITKTDAPPREGLVGTYEGALTLMGDSARGRQIFAERCASCHRFGGAGHSLGPDLASVRSNGKEKLLAAILDPSREVAPQFTGYVAETKDGESYSGVMLTQTDGSITLRVAGGTDVTLRRNQLTSLTAQRESIMPTGLDSGLTVQDMANLLEYIVTGEETAP